MNMKNLRKQLAILTAIACMMTAAGCADSSSVDETAAEQTNSVSEPASESDSGVQADALSASVLSADLSKADLNTDWDDSAVTLQFDGDTVTPSATEGLKIENGVVRIVKGGDYVLSGKLNDGRIVIDLEDAGEKVHLILNGVEISCSTSAAITVLQADKTIITLAKGTKNTLSDASEYSVFDIEDSDGNYPGACIASKDDLTINGEGSLTVSGNYNNGIHCADDLCIVSGNITVTAKNHGLRGNDSVLIHDGTISVTSGGDGIKTSAEDKDGKGYVLIEGGSVTVNSDQDGVDAASSLTVTGGDLNITSGGGTANAKTHSGDNFGGFDGSFGGFGGRNHGGRSNENSETDEQSEPDNPFGEMQFNSLASYQLTASAADTDQTSSDVSTKALKAETALTVTGGKITLNSADDGIHSNQTVSIGGDAEITVAAGDDGIHADSLIEISGGNTNITQSNEGIESADIRINGGNMRVKSSDDGLNASDGNGGGMGFSRNGSGELTISGGYVYVNADGDGLDSNGNITMTGGTAVVCGPTNNGNGPLDSGDNNNTITVTGGTLIAVGSTGMMEVPESNYLASAELNAEAGTLIVVTDESGSVLAALKTPKQAQGIVVSVNGISDGYQIYTGGSYDGTFNEDNFAAGGSYSGGTLIASGSGGGSNGGFGGFGGRGGKQQTPPDGFDGNMTPPDRTDGNMTPPEGFDGNMTPPDGFDGNMTPPDGNHGGHGRGGHSDMNTDS